MCPCMTGTCTLVLTRMRGAFKSTLLKKPHFFPVMPLAGSVIYVERNPAYAVQGVADEHFYVFARFYGFRNLPAVRAAEMLPHVLPFTNSCAVTPTFQIQALRVPYRLY